jgi:HD-GYP domain-containing protein (c-di-GMP phosphodiesterase class II)
LEGIAIVNESRGLVQELPAIEQRDSNRCYLVAPLEIETIALQTGLEIAETTVGLTDPLQRSGILVCLPHMPMCLLPPGWTGVWARDEPLPSGPWVPLPPEMAGNSQALSRALWTAETWRRERLASDGDVKDNAATLKSLNEIGIALSAERNPAQLLNLILSRACQLVAADAGSLYLVEKDKHGNTVLRFALAQNDSVHAPWKASLLPLNRRSVAGAVAEGNTVVVVDDAYALPADGPIQHDHSFDTRFGYRTRSIVGIPLATREGEVLGVLQLINRKSCPAVPLTDAKVATEVLSFSTSDIEVLRSLASQAAISLENSRLYEDIERLFEGFVTASVTAIEQRDPSTSGHSARVAEGTVALALRVEQLEHGPWAGSRFTKNELRELRYAALLHDFGKVGVREKVLTKADKLYEEQLEALRQRFVLAQMIHRAERFEAWLEAALQDPQGMKKRLPLLYEELWHELNTIRTMFRTVEAANQPSVTPEGEFSTLQPIRRWEFLQPDGHSFSLLTDGEMQALSLRRGSLTDDERREIQSHVTHTYHFLQTIPWTRDLAHVPKLAYGHHEKLDGSGYPLGLKAQDIPLGVRIMTIADIFDALTATDRPYKKALPIERALGILEAEVRENKLDESLVRLWIEARVWESIRA